MQTIVIISFIIINNINYLKKVDLKDTKNLFIASTILVLGIGGLSLKFGNPLSPVIQITSTAVAMIAGIILNFSLKSFNKQETTETVALEKIDIDSIVEEIKELTPIEYRTLALNGLF